MISILLGIFGCGKTEQQNTVIFLGDSITEQGDLDSGFVATLRRQLKGDETLKQCKIINAGISGDKVTDLQARLEGDVLCRKPALVVVYIGTNDVWHFELRSGEGTLRDQYEEGLRDVLSRIKQTGARVIVCTPAVIGEKKDGTNSLDEMLDDYCEVNRSVARSFDAPLVDLRHLFLSYLRDHNETNAEEGILTRDGVHLNKRGNKLVADALLSVLPKELAETALR